MGVHKEPNHMIYWETLKLNGPIHAISKHMSLNRYENLRRYLHVSPLKRSDYQMKIQHSLEPLQTCSKAQEAQEVQEAQEAQKPSLSYLENPEEEEEQWWWRLEPILGTFCTACQIYLISGTEVAINEIMIRFYERSSDIYKMLNKSIKQDYKVFALADDDYV
jgi:hypothetical protein